MKKGIAVIVFIIAVWGLFFMPTESRGPLLICGAVWLFFLPKRDELEAYKYNVLQYTALQQSVYAHEVTLVVAFGILAKAWLFPIFFGIYLFFLFIQQTHLFNLQFSWFFLLFDEWVYFFLLLVSVFFISTVKQQTYKKYVLPVRSAFIGISYLLLVGAVGCLSSWIVGQATISVGPLAHLISSLTGVCVVLLGFLLFGAEDEEITE